MLKSSLLNILKRNMDLTVATRIHGIKITVDKRQNPEILKFPITRRLFCMLVLVTTLITKTHGKHLCKDGMAYPKTHVELMPI